jgi:dolichyl-phosphooligosaccharide-protein glycotransferase
MRKRAQRRSQQFEEQRYVYQPEKPVFEKKSFKFNKKWWVGLTLICVFFLVLFMNTYYNFTSDIAINPEGTGFDKFYLSGPDPYYNLRLVNLTYETGEYLYYFDYDPLLNYPLGASGRRAPLFNMMALGFSRVLVPFMGEVDAIGYSMQFIPALFGALLIFVVYFIGKELFNWKAGLIAAFLLAIIPIHLGSGHGSAYSLFDHDSFNLLLFFLTFLFLIKSLKEKDRSKSLLYAIMGGVFLAGLSMVWVEAHYLYVVIAIYAFVQYFIDIFTNKINSKTFFTTSSILLSGVLISSPVLIFTPNGFQTNVSLYIALAVLLFGIIYYLFGRLKTPWTISIPTLLIIGSVGLSIIYFAKDVVSKIAFLGPLTTLNRVIFGSGIYGDKVSMTIAEANTQSISQTVMSFGPAIYWIGWLGLVYLCYQYYKNKTKKEYLFIIVLFLTNIWLSTVAGRFLNDMVPVICVLAGWILWIFVDWIDYKQMIRNVRSAGGGLHGIRRGVKVLHIFGVLLLAFIIILPNAFVAFDAAVPNASNPDNEESLLKWDMFGTEHQGAFGLGVYKEKYWGHAFNWLNQQDTEITDETKRPAFISWWDYGFYAVALSGHPTVADNFQSGIPVAGNFHTATSEKEAISVLIIRLLEGIQRHEGKVTPEIIDILNKYLEANQTEKIVIWMKDPTSAASYGEPIGEQYDEQTSKDYRVGGQWAVNAVYHDIVALFNEALTQEQVILLYNDLQDATGWSIRYYGVEGYDKQIFNIFAFLSDKSLLMINGIEDDFIQLLYTGYTVDSQGRKLQDKTWTAQEILGMSQKDRSMVAVTGTSQIYKDPYFDTMFYKTYVGWAEGESGSKSEPSIQMPCYEMKHFYAEYFSDLSMYPYYNTGKSAVVIAKYYAGAHINGTVIFNNQTLDCEIAVVKNVTYAPEYTIPIDHDKADTGSDGTFNLLAGAGASLQIRQNLGQGTFIMTNVTFEGEYGTDLAPITDDDAMRRNSSNFERNLKIVINPADFSGYVFNDTNYDGIYNETDDEPLSDVVVTLYKITSFLEDSVQLDTQNFSQAITNEAGYYEFTNLLPGIYRMIVENEDGFAIYFDDVALYEGNNTYDIVNVKPANLEGIIYYDNNANDKYDAGEELSDVDVELLVDTSTQFEISTKTIATMKTGVDGKYRFESIIPGKINNNDFNTYIITAEKHPDYKSEVYVYPAENITTYLNISIELAPVVVSGYTKYGNLPIGNIPIYYDVDESVDKNTAKYTEILSDESGYYEIELTPGSYNVTCELLTGNTLVYTYEGKLTVSKGQQVLSNQDIPLEKKSATISGFTTYVGTRVDNISISFVNKQDVSYIYSPKSDETGYYTLEVALGNYTVEVNQTGEINAQNYTYRFTGSLEVKSVTDISYQITMTREAVD